MNILIFYGAYGGGHLSAARSIKECIEQNFDGHTTKLVDCIDYISPTINKLSTKAYAEMAKKTPKLWGQLYSHAEKGSLSKLTIASNKLMSKKLYKFFDEFNPDLIISTHPFSTQMCAMLRKEGKINAKIATILTDYAPHEQWLLYHEYADYYFVAHEGMRDELLQKGIPSFKVFSTGIPLSNRFLQSYNKEETLKNFDLSIDKGTVLFFAGGEFGLRKKQNFCNLKIIN